MQQNQNPEINFLVVSLTELEHLAPCRGNFSVCVRVNCVLCFCSSNIFPIHTNEAVTDQACQRLTQGQRSEHLAYKPTHPTTNHMQLH